ncbi:response regulator [Marisediminicola senii]|uniref:response regulator n=1 Tax=Marisediminicola senii TaxID=2711233 RepID=UPI0013ECA783|nr:response regulator transcription factor [Marisediminicola senii]
MKSSARIVIVASDQPLPRAIRSELEARPGFTVVDDVSDGPAALAAAEVHRPDIVLLDVQLVSGDAFDVARRITEAWPDTWMLALTHPADYPVDVLMNGASGFLHKDARPADLVAAIRAVLRNDVVVADDTPRITARMIERRSPATGTATRRREGSAGCSSSAWASGSGCCRERLERPPTPDPWSSP